MAKQTEYSENSTQKLNASNILNLDNKNYRALLDHVCNETAQRFNMYDSSGKVRNATIIDVIAKTLCIACITQKFSGQSVAGDVDSLYKECHKLAINVLVEELYYCLSQMGFKVLISTEAELEYGKADILITITNYGLNLKGNAKELLVEVKTGNSLSLSQLFRYLLDEKSDTIVVWRIRRRQVLVFNAQEIKPLLTEFMRIICLRANRLLSSQQIQPCQHKNQWNYKSSQEELEKAFKEFSAALVETLPVVLQTIIKQLEDVIPLEPINNGQNKNV